MLKTQHPIDYLKKEEIVEQVEEQYIEQIKELPKLKRYRRSDSDDEREKNRELFSAIYKNKLQEVTQLLDSGVKINIIDGQNKDNTPLHYAIEKGKKEIIELLLDRGADITIKNRNDKSSLELATESGNQEIINILTYRKINVPGDGSCLFWAAALAYLIPVKYDDNTFRERFERLFESTHSQELTQVQNLIKAYEPSSNSVAISNDETLKRLVTEKFRNRVVNEIRQRPTQFEDTITIHDFLNSKNEDYVIGGTFQEKFRNEFNTEISQYNIDITKLKPSTLNEATVQEIDSELDKIPDQDKVKKLKFETYLECMRDSKAWGGNHEIQAMSQVLHSSILIFSDSIKHSINYDNSNDQIQLFNSGESHYNFGLVRAPILIEAIKGNKQQEAKTYLSLGIDNINYQDSEGHTALHFANQHNDVEITQLLLDQGASSIQQSPVQQPMDIDVEPKSGPSSPKKPRLSTEDLDERSSDHQNFLSESTYPGEGGRPGQRGNIFQLKLLMLFLLHAQKENNYHSFRIAAEIGEAEKFDDVVLQYQPKRSDSWKFRLLQAKHVKDKITEKELLSINDDNFSLQKYFHSYLKIMQRSKEGSIYSVFAGSEIEDLIICTNTDFDSHFELGKGEGDIERDEIFKLQKDQNKQWEKASIRKLGSKASNKIAEKLKPILEDTSDFNRLVEELADSVLEEKQVDNKKDLFKEYYYALARNVLDIKNMKTEKVGKKKKYSLKLLSEFIDGNEVYGEEKEFRNALIKEIVFRDEKKKWKVKVSEDFGKSKLPDDRAKLQELAKELASKIKSNKELVLSDFEDYHVALVQNKVINVNDGKFYSEFSSRKSDLRDLLKKEMGFNTIKDMTEKMKDIKLNISKDFGKSELPDDYEKLKDLAEKLAKCVGENKDLTTSEFKDYHLALAEKVIDVKDTEEAKFQEIFVDRKIKKNDKYDHLPSLSKAFRRIFLDKLIDIEAQDIKDNIKKLKGKEIKISNGFAKAFKPNEDLKIDDVEQFAKQIKELLVSNQDKKVIEINESTVNSELEVFKGNINKLSGYVLIERHKKIRFSTSFLRSDEEDHLPGNLKDFRDKLKDLLGVNLFESIYQYEFDIKFDNSKKPEGKKEWFKTCEEGALHRKLPTIHTNQNVEEFFSKLKFVVNYPNHEELNTLLEGNIKDMLKKLDSEAFKSLYLDKLQSWMADEVGTFYTPDKAKTLFSNIGSKLELWTMDGFTNSYFTSAYTKYTFNKYNDITEFLENENKQVLHFVFEDLKLGRTRIVQTFKDLMKDDPNKIKAYTRGFGHIFLHSGQLLDDTFYNSVFTWFNDDKSGNLIAIEYDTQLNDQKIKTLFSSLTSVIEPKNKKKVILITKKDNALGKKFEDELGNDKYQSKVDDTTFNNLTPESQEKLLTEGKVTFQGKEVSLGTLIDDESKHLINAKVLSKLINDKEVKVGNELQDLGEVEGYYIPRTLNHQIKIKGSFKKEISKFFITYNSQVTESNLQQGQDIVLISDTDDHFNELCNSKDYGEHNIHWLKKENDEFIWQNFHGGLKGFRNHVYQDNTEQPIEPENVGNKFVIVSAEPGMGKSTLLTKLEQKMKKSDPSLSIMRINLNDYRDKWNNAEFDDIDAAKAVDFLLDISNLKTSLEKELFRDRLVNQGKVSLLFDGLEEISPHCIDKVIRLIEILKETKVEKLWITTRPHMRSELDEFIWQKSRGSLKELRKFIYKNEQHEYQPEKITDIPDKIVIISAESGMGKSTVLTKLAEKTKKSDPSLWIIRINLNDYMQKLDEINFSNDKDKVINFLLDMADLKTPLEKELWKSRVNHQGKIALLFDGFDEISPTCEEKVIELLQILKDTKVEKLWATTRPHMRDKLEDELGILAYTLEPLSRKNQETFLKKFWSKSLNLSNINKAQLEKYIEESLDLLSRSITDTEEFIGIPLQIRLFAEVYEFSDKANLPKKLDLVDLYKQFVEKKHKDWYLIGKKIIYSAQIDKVYKSQQESFVKKHRLLALSTLFSEEDLNKLLSNTERDEIKKYKEEVKKGEENVGIINDIISDKPRFVHPSYAEYFASDYLWENFKSIEDKEFENRFLKDVIIKNTYGDHKLQIYRFFYFAAQRYFAKDTNFSDKDQKINILLKNLTPEITKYPGYKFDNLSQSIKLLFTIIELSLSGEEKKDLKTINSVVIDEYTKLELLRISAENGCIKFTNALIRISPELKSDHLDYYRKWHFTPFWLAAKNSHIDIAKTLIEKFPYYPTWKADIYGYTLLEFILQRKEFNVLRSCLKLDIVDVSSTYRCENNDEKSPLVESITNYAPSDVIELLIEKTDIDFINKFTTGAIPAVVYILGSLMNYDNDESLMNLLVKKGIDFNVGYDDGGTPLNLIIFEFGKNIYSVPRYYSGKLDLDERRSDNSNFFNLVKSLLRYGAIYNLEDYHYNNVPLQNAKQIHHTHKLFKAVCEQSTEGNGETVGNILDKISDQVLRLMIERPDYYFISNHEAYRNSKIAFNKPYFSARVTGKEILFIPEYIQSLFWQIYAKGDTDGKVTKGTVGELSSYIDEFREKIEEWKPGGWTVSDMLDKLQKKKTISPNDSVMGLLERVMELYINQNYEIDEALTEVSKEALKFNKKVSYVKNWQKIEVYNLKKHGGLAVKRLFIRSDEISMGIKENNIEEDLISKINESGEMAYLNGALLQLNDIGQKNKMKVLETMFQFSDQSSKTFELLKVVDDLFNAVQRNNIEHVKRLLQEAKSSNAIKAVINAQDKNRRTPLHKAAKYGYEGVVSTLLNEVKDDIEELSRLLFDTKEYWITPLHYAALYDHTKTIDILLGEMRKSNPDSLKELVSGQEDNVIDINDRSSVVEQLRKRAAEILIKNKHYTILHEAVRGNKEEIIKLILNKIKEKNENIEQYINALDNEGNTPLIWAARDNKVDMIVILLQCEHDIDIDIQNINGETALYLAAKGGYQKVVELLLSAGADPDLFDNKGIYPVDFAWDKFIQDIKNKENLQILEQFRSETTRFKEFSLLRAIERSNIDIVNYLVEKEDVDVNSGYYFGQIFLHEAASYGNVDIIDVLLKRTKNIDAVDMSERTPLHCAVRKGHFGAVELLLNKKANPNLGDKNKKTSLHYAAQEGHIEIIELLLKNGAKIDVVDVDDWTPLHDAAFNNHFNSINSLLKEGTNINTVINAINTNNMTPLDLAAKKNNWEFAIILLRKGANNNLNVHQKRNLQNHIQQKPEGIKEGYSDIIDLLAQAQLEVPMDWEVQTNQDNKLKRPAAVDDNSVPTKVTKLDSEGNQPDPGDSNTQIQSHKNQQKVFVKLNKYIDSKFHDAEVKAVKQGIYLPSFESRNVKIKGKCAAITRIFSQGLFLEQQGETLEKSHESFLNNLQTSAELYERIAQGKQLSSREEKEIFALSRLLSGVEEEVISPTSSLPSHLSHIKSYKTLDDLSHYVNGLTDDFAIHLVTSNHVVAIYRTGDSYTYFDSNVALVSNLKSVDQLMKVVEKGVKYAGYALAEEGFLVEHFDVSKANKALTPKQKEVLTKPIQTERHLLSLQDQELGPIDVDGEQVSRVTLYDMGAKLHVDGSSPILINSEMSSKDLAANLNSGKIKITAREYLQNLKDNKKEVIQDLVQTTSSLPFSGSMNEVKDAQTIQDLVLSEDGQRLNSYELNKILSGRVEQSIKALPYYLEVANTKHWPNRLTNAAGRISMAKGLYDVAHSIRYGDTEGFLLGSGEIGFSLFSQLIEDGVVKVTPQFIKQMKHGIFLSRGFAGMISSPFDIYDLIRSSIDLAKAEKGSKEWRDSIAGVVLSGTSVTTSIAFTAFGKPGVGTVVGLGIIIGQGFYSGTSMVIEYKKYKLTTNQEFRLFWHTFALQLPPEDVQYLAARQDVVNGLAEQAWEYLQNNTQIAAYAMGLGEISFKDNDLTRVKRMVVDIEQSMTGARVRHNVYVPEHNDLEETIKDIIPKPKTVVVNPSSASIGMNNPSNEREGKNLSRIVPKSPSSDAQMLCLPEFTHRDYEYDNEKPMYSNSSTAIYHCSNSIIIGRKNNKNPTMVFDLSLVNGSGIIVSSSQYRNQFNIDQGEMRIHGSNYTSNVFTLTNDNFFGTVIGGTTNATNVLDASQLKSEGLSYENNIVTTQEAQMTAKNINHFIGRNSADEHVDCQNMNNKMIIDSRGGNGRNSDVISNCKQVVVTGNTKVVSNESDNTFYIKPSNGYTEINGEGKGFIIFSDTALLEKASNISYLAANNTLSLQINLQEENGNGTFTLDIHNYLDKENNHNYVLIDKHGSVVEPLIQPNSTEVINFNLKAETNLTTNAEIAERYKEISQTSNNYTVYGVIRDLAERYTIFGSNDSDVIPLTQNVTFAQGNEESDVYSLMPEEKVNVTINNYDNSDAIDMLYLPMNVTQAEAEKVENDLHISTGNATINVENYFRNSSYRHLTIIDKNKNTFLPWSNNQSYVQLVPFFHATKDQFMFLLSEGRLANNPEVIVDAKLDDIRFYRDGNDLVLIDDKPLIVKVENFYGNQYENFTLNFRDKDKLSSKQLFELAKLAINYQDEIRNTYYNSFREYRVPTFNSTIHHNQRFVNGSLTTVEPNDKRVGILLLQDTADMEVSTDNNDLVFFVAQSNATFVIKNWNDTDHRISMLKFGDEDKSIEVRKLDKFDLSEVSEIQAVINKAAISNTLDEQLDGLDTEVVNGLKYLLASNGIVNKVNVYDYLGFDSEEDQQEFIAGYSTLYNKDKLQEILQDSQAVESLRLLIAKGHINLSLKDSDKEKHLLLKDLDQCFGAKNNFTIKNGNDRVSILKFNQSIEVDLSEVSEIQHLIGKYGISNTANQQLEKLGNEVVNDFKYLLVSIDIENGIDLYNCLAEKDTQKILNPYYYEWVNWNLVKDLIEEKKVDVNSKANDGNTLLHEVTSSGNLDIVEYLIDKGGDVNTKANDGRTPLHHAASSGSLDLVKYLVDEKGVNVNTKDNDGKTSLHYAAYSGNLDLVKYLEKSVDINTKDNDGNTILHDAVSSDNLDLVKYLIEEGADVNAETNGYWTPLHKAAEKGNKEIVLALLNNDVDVNAKTNGGYTALHWAALSGNKETVLALLNNGANVNAKIDSGETPLHLAASKGNKEAVLALLNKGADVKAKDDSGWTPLRTAEHHGKGEIVVLLNHQTHQRSRRAINEENIASSATRVGSGINDLFGWVKSSIGGLFNSRAALPENNTTQSSISQVDAQVSVDGTIMLLDLLIRKVTDQKHISTEGQSISLLEAQGYASSITLEFDTLLKRTARSCGIQDANFNPMVVQSAIVKQMRNGTYSEISKTLYSSAEKACPDYKQTDKFLARLKNNLEEVVAEKEVELLVGKQKGLSKVISNNKLVEKSVLQVKEDKPNTFLNGTSIAKGIGNVLGL